MTDEVIVTVIATGFEEDKEKTPLYNNIQNARRATREPEIITSSNDDDSDDGEFDLPPFLRERNY